jgi:hypothetical protein
MGCLFKEIALLFLGCTIILKGYNDNMGCLDVVDDTLRSRRLGEVVVTLFSLT